MAVTFPYVRAATWADGSTTDTAAKRNTMEDGIFNAHQQPAVRVTHNANQSITDSTVTALAFNTERFDQAGGASSTQHDTVTNNSRLTCRYAGIYLIGGQTNWGASNLGYRQAFIRLNGTGTGTTTTLASNRVLSWTAGSGLVDACVDTLYSLAVNDYVELCVFQNSGGALNVLTSGNISPEFWMVRVG